MILYKYSLGLLIFFFVLSVTVRCTEELPVKLEETRSLMDTYIRVVVYANEESAEGAINAAFDRIEEIEKIRIDNSFFRAYLKEPVKSFLKIILPEKIKAVL